jgi:hypothetical protein
LCGGIFPKGRQADEKKTSNNIGRTHKNNHIEILLFKTAKVYSFSLMTSVGDGGVGLPDMGPYRSFFEARNAALHSILRRHHSPLEKKLLAQFRLMKDLDQPYLFDE